MAAKSKIVGVLGGMGPHATGAFFQAVLNLTPAKKSDHLRILKSPAGRGTCCKVSLLRPPRMLESCKTTL